MDTNADENQVRPLTLNRSGVGRLTPRRAMLEYPLSSDTMFVFTERTTETMVVSVAGDGGQARRRRIARFSATEMAFADKAEVG